MKPTRAHLAFATLLCFVLSLAYIGRVEPLFPNSPPGQRLQVHIPGVAGRGLIDDEHDYVLAARNLLQGNGYSLNPGHPTALRQPLYSIFLAAAFRLHGISVSSALLANAVLLALLPLLAFFIARPLFGPTVAIVAAYICVLDPALYYFGVGMIYSEALFAFTLCAAMAIWIHCRLRSTGLLLPAIAAGILFGAAALTRSGFLLFPVVLLAGEILVRAPRRNLKAATVLCLAAFATVAPWVVRNQLVLHSPVLSSTNDGTTLLGSVLAAERGRGDWLNPAALSPQYAVLQKFPDEVARSRQSRQLALQELKRIPPSQLATVALKRITRVWVPATRLLPDEAGRRLNIVLSAAFLPIILLGLYGIAVTLPSVRQYFLKPSREPDVREFNVGYAALPIFLAALYITLISAAVWGSTRFRYPLEPMLAAFSGFGLVQAVRFFSKSLNRAHSETRKQCA